MATGRSWSAAVASDFGTDPFQARTKWPTLARGAAGRAPFEGRLGSSAKATGDAPAPRRLRPQQPAWQHLLAHWKLAANRGGRGSRRQPVRGILRPRVHRVESSRPNQTRQAAVQCASASCSAAPKIRRASSRPALETGRPRGIYARFVVAGQTPACRQDADSTLRPLCPRTRGMSADADRQASQFPEVRF